MSSRRRIAYQTGIAVLGLVTIFVLFLRNQFMTIESRYYRVATGMEITEVEGILGLGTPVPDEEIPRMPQTQSGTDSDGSRPVVEGDRVLKWTQGDRLVLVGFSNNRVVGKWYWEPSL